MALKEISRPAILMLAVPAAMFILVIELVRRRRLREDYSLLWLATCVLLIFLTIFRDTVLYIIAEQMGIFYPPAALFVIGFGLLMLILLQFSMVITRLTRENKQAAQHIALLGMRVRELERQLDSTRRE